MEGLVVEREVYQGVPPYEKVVVKEGKDILYYYDGVFPVIRVGGKEIRDWNFVHWARASEHFKKVRELIRNIVMTAWDNGELKTHISDNNGGYRMWVVKGQHADHIKQIINQISQLLP